MTGWDAVMETLFATLPHAKFTISHWTDTTGTEHWFAASEEQVVRGRGTANRYLRYFGEGPDAISAVKALIVEAQS